MSVFDDTIEEVDAARAAAEPPAPAENTAGGEGAREPQAAEQTPPAEPSGAGAQGAQAEQAAEGAEADTDAELQSDIEARRAKDGDNWAIRGYRELMDERRRHKPVLEHAPDHGPSLVKTGAELAALVLDRARTPEVLDGLVQKLSPQRRTELRDHY